MVDSQSQILPDTCPTSQNDDLPGLNTHVRDDRSPWGLLYPTKPEFKSLEMVKNEYLIGRAPHCDLIFGKGLSEDFLLYISKEHFRVKRVLVSNSNENDYAVHLTDLSFNGTFLNGRRIGKGQSSILENNDEISLAFPNFKVFTYVNGHLDAMVKSFPKQVREQYAVSRILGAGACGVVRLVFEKSSGKALAMKIVQKKQFNVNVNINDLNYSSRLQREVNILKALSNDFVIRFENVIDSSDHMFIVTEYVEGGELFERVRKGITEAQAKFYFYQLARAIKYLHSQRIIHRDVKLENVLLSSFEPETLIKLSDFGYSKFIDPESVMNTFCGTPLYIAPEILKTKGKTGTYDEKVDIWSMGVVLYMCLSATPPFSSGRKDKSLGEQILEGSYKFPEETWQGVSSKAKNLVRRMLTVDPDKRITVEEILGHAWLQDKGMKIKVYRLLSKPTRIKDDLIESSKRRKIELV